MAVSQRQALAGLAVAIIAISTGAILVRLSNAPSAVAAFYRVLLTTVPLIPVALWRYRDAFRALTVGQIGGALVAGLALALHFAAWFESLEWTSVAASVTLVQSQPLFVAVGAWLVLSEQMNRRVIAGIVITVGGMIGISIGDLTGGAVGSDPILGNSLAVIGAVMMAVYVVAGRSLRQQIALIPYVVIVYSVATIGLLGVVLASGESLGGYAGREWVIFAGLAIGPGLLGHTLINWALGYLDSSLVSVSLLGEPVGAAILAAILFTEIPTAATVIGGAIVLAGIYLTAQETTS